MHATRSAFFSVLAAAAAIPAAAQPTSLLFSTKNGEDTRSGSNGTQLQHLAANSVALVTPTPAFAQSAEAFAPALGYQTIAGDTTGAGTTSNPFLMSAADAVLVKPYERDPQTGNWVPRFSPVEWFDVYVSPKVDVGTNVSGAPGLRRGDCGVILRTAAGNGQVRHFITAEQIIDALGMFDPMTLNKLTPSDIDLDAIAVDNAQNIFLSFEEDHWMRVNVGGALANFPLLDGSVAWLPPIAWVPDALGDVAGVNPQLGRIALTEAQMDAMVVNANVADVAGNCVNTVGDTDALALDRNGGVFVAWWGGAAFNLPNLLFGGETLTGAGVLSTAGGGSIAVANGSPLARGCGNVTDGRQMGLLPSGAVDSLAGLESLRGEPCRFVLDSPTPLGLGGMIEVHVGTNMPLPGGGVFLLIGLGTLPISASIDILPFFPATQCFTELYPATLAVAVWVPIMPDGFGDFTGVFGPIAAPAFAPGILFQAAGIGGGTAHLSSPVTLH